MLTQIEVRWWVGVGRAVGIDVGYTCSLLANEGWHGVMVAYRRERRGGSARKRDALRVGHTESG